MTRRHLLIAFVTVCGAIAAAPAWAGTPFIPGTGEFLADCSDNFEDPNWKYVLKLPKSSSEQDENSRPPGGISSNRLWHEGALRGTPDVVKRIPTPPGGIEGSTGALMFATQRSGIPGKITNKQQQDDLLMKFDRKLGRSISMSWQPSCTVRVYLPAFENWEQRNGPSFGMRADCRGRKPDGSTEPYWPGMFWLFRKANGKSIPEDFAQLTVRSGPRGNDLRNLKATEPGWWTMGMSFTSDGQIHYYARKGVEDLTAEDYLTSQFPYGDRCLSFNNFFFNVANQDNGRSWSTSWVIDDPKIYVIPPQGQTVAQLYKNRAKKSNRNMARKPSTRSTQSAKSGNTKPATASRKPTQR
jgi:hypothetical protein